MPEEKGNKKIDMNKTFYPEKYQMDFCPSCRGKGKLPNDEGEVDVCKECGGFGLIKKESDTSEDVENRK